MTAPNRVIEMDVAGGDVSMVAGVGQTTAVWQASQYLCVKRTTVAGGFDISMDICGSNEMAAGILMTKPKQYEAGRVRTLGTAPAKAGSGAITVGMLVGPGAAGVLENKTADGDYVIGIAETACDANKYFSVRLLGVPVMINLDTT